MSLSSRIALLVAGLMFSTTSHAVTMQFTLDELVQKLNEAKVSGNPVSQLLADKIQAHLDQNNVQIVGDSLVVGQWVDYSQVLWRTCDEAPLFGILVPDPWSSGLSSGYFTGSISSSGSSVTLAVKDRRISATVSLSGRVSGDATFFVIWAWKYWDPLKLDWKCADKKKDKVDGSLDALVNATATLTMDVANLSVSGNSIVIQNNFQLTGDVRLPEQYAPGVINPVLTIGSSYFIEDNLTEQLFKDLVHGAEFNRHIWSALKQGLFEPSLDGAFQDWLSAQQQSLVSRYGTYTIEVQLPPLDDERIIVALKDLLTERYGYQDHPGLVNVLYSFVKAHALEILYYALTDNQDGLDGLLANAGCEAVKVFETPLNAPTLYAVANNSCKLADPFAAATGNYYLDNQCRQQRVQFVPPDRGYFCRTLFGRQPNLELGNAAGLGDGSVEPWTVSYGNRLNILAEANTGTSQPVMKRVLYRSIPGADRRSQCDLEMRVYKKDIDATGLQPLMVIHGGSWKYRAPFFALEASISQYTDAGFVVFAPFYRMVGDADGSSACNGVGGTEVVADIEAALDWVIENMNGYGANSGERVALVGQSAGAHLAAWLVTHRPNDTSRALLLYPPTDVLDFLRNLSGQYASFNSPSSLDPLNAFYKVEDVGAIDLNNPPPFFMENSFPGKITSSTPPVFLIHGVSDALVPSNQSVLLCNAYGGSAQNSGGGENLRAQFTCGQGHLHLFEYGEHGLDACLRGQSGVAQSSLCLSGNDATADLVSESMAAARAWLRAGSGTPICTGARCP